jgi:hypothetical protein
MTNARVESPHFDGRSAPWPHNLQARSWRCQPSSAAISRACRGRSTTPLSRHGANPSTSISVAAFQPAAPFSLIAASDAMHSTAPTIRLTAQTASRQRLGPSRASRKSAPRYGVYRSIPHTTHQARSAELAGTSNTNCSAGRNSQTGVPNNSQLLPGLS